MEIKTYTKKKKSYILFFSYNISNISDIFSPNILANI